MGTTRTLLTFEEFERLPDEPGKCELLRGKLLELPPAELRHNRVSHRIYDGLKSGLNQAHARGEAGLLGEAWIETGYLLPSESFVQPDVSMTHAGQREAKYFIGAPATVVEVLSPSNSPAKLEIKRKLYFEAGALEVWHFNQKKRQVTVFTLAGAKILTNGDSLTTPLLPGFSILISEILSSALA